MKNKYYELGVKVELHLKVVKRCMVKQHTPDNKTKYVEAWERDISDDITLTKGEKYKELGLTDTDTETILRDIGDQAIFDMDDIRDHESEEIEKEIKKIVNLIDSQEN